MISNKTRLRVVALVGLLILTSQFNPNRPPPPRQLYAQTAQPDSPARAHRIAAAEQMIERLTAKSARVYAACDQFSVKPGMQRVAEECKAAVRQATPILTKIRDVAERDDPAEWIKLVEYSQKLEREIDGELYSAERNK